MANCLPEIGIIEMTINPHAEFKRNTHIQNLGSFLPQTPFRHLTIMAMVKYLIHGVYDNRKSMAIQCYCFDIYLK